VALNALVPWGDLRPRLEAVWRRPAGERKSRAGRKPWDAVVMFKAMVLSALYNLSDEQLEHQLRDRLTFMRFLGLGLEDPTPDATTIWLYREQLVRAGLVDELFGAFDAHLKAQGWLAMGGQMIDASIVPVPKQRNTRAENAAIKAGETPEGWDDKPALRLRTRSKVRARVEHVFGAQSNDMGGVLLRCIGIVRARARIGLRNLAYTMRRMVQLAALAAARAPT